MPDAIILDYHMPGMGTVEFLSSLRGLANGKKPFVVYCTTENDTADITRTIAAGADDYVIKPFDREALRTQARCGRVGFRIRVRRGETGYGLTADLV